MLSTRVDLALGMLKSSPLRTPKTSPFVHHVASPKRVTHPFNYPHRKMSTITSPPHSPLPKRQKPNPNPAIPNTMDTTATAGLNGTFDTQGNRTSPSKSLFGAPPPLKIKKLSFKARLPTRGSEFAAGYDLYAAKDTIVPGRGKVLVHTDIAIAVPIGTCTSAPFSPRIRTTC